MLLGTHHLHPLRVIVYSCLNPHPECRWNAVIEAGEEKGYELGCLQHSISITTADNLDESIEKATPFFPYTLLTL